MRHGGLLVSFRASEGHFCPFAGGGDRGDPGRRQPQTLGCVVSHPLQPWAEVIGPPLQLLEGAYYSKLRSNVRLSRVLRA